ncbi:MAG: NAD(P)-binding domain-containing protein [Chlorobi bacterium]|nr:NAD(P)-binding domain-containing protein [Chlorobiota bacterium]
MACGVYARRAELRQVVIEKETIVNTIVGYPRSITFFSTPERRSIGDLPFSSPHFRPSRQEAIVY